MTIRLLQTYSGLPIGTELSVESEVGFKLVGQGVAALINSGAEIKKASVEITRPANTTLYTAGDVIAAAATAVKQKETLTLSGSFGTATIAGPGGLTKTVAYAVSLTATAQAFVTAYVAAYLAAGIIVTSSGPDIIFEAAVAGVPFTAPTITNLTCDLTASVAHTTANVTAVKQKYTVTLAGSYGTTTITGVGGLTKIATFDTDLGTTAGNFVTANAAPYLAAGVTLTASGSDLIFEAATAGTVIAAPVSSGVVGNLTGTVAHTTANRVAVAQIDIVTLTGTSGVAHITVVGGLEKDALFNATLKQTADDFVATHAAAYLAEGVIVTAGLTDTLIFTSAVAGVPIDEAVVVPQLGDLDGTWAASQANVTAVAQVETIAVTATGGYAVVAAAGGLTKYITYNTSVHVSLDNFITTNAALYLAQGIILSREAANLKFTAQTAGTGFTAPTITNVPGLRGTVVATTANRVAVKQVENITFAGTFGQGTVGAAGGLTSLVTFATSWAATLDAFVATNLALYDAQGIILTVYNNILTMTAKVAGTGFTAPTFTALVNLAGTNVSTTANVTIAPLIFSSMVMANGAATLDLIKVETNMTALAGMTLRLWFYNALPTVVADNAAFVELYANKDKFLFSADVTMGQLLAGSDMVSGTRSAVESFATVGTDIYCIIQTVTGFSPTSGGKINVTLHTEYEADTVGGNKAVVVPANATKYATDKVTLVQSVDEVGGVIKGYSAHSYLPATHWSPAHGACTYLSANTLTCTGWPFTVDANSAIRSIGVTNSLGVMTLYENGVLGVSINAAANVITLLKDGASYPAFQATDLSYKVAIAQTFQAIDVTTDVMKVIDQAPDRSSYVIDSLLDTVNLAAATNYLPASTGISMDGFRDMSLTGKFIDADGTFTMTVEATNDEDSAAATWVQIYGFDTKNNAMVTSWTVTNGTLTFAIDFDNLNYSLFRVVVINNGATNTAELKCRRKSL